MSQGDQSVANASGATVRADINSELQALASLSSGASAPGTTYPNQLWIDTTNAVLKRRDNANSAWMIVDTMDTDRVLAKTAGYTVQLRDVRKLILGDTSSAGFTLTLPTVASAGEGFRVECKNTGSGGNALTLDGDGTETINGETTIALADDESAIVWCDGAAWHAIRVEKRVVQQVRTQTGALATGTGIIPGDDTIPQNDEGDEYMSVSITPKNANNLLVIDVTIQLSSTVLGALIAALFQDSTADALASMTDTQDANRMSHLNFSHRMIAGTTSLTTFKVRAAGNNPGTTTFNGNGGTGRFGGTLASSITITEIAP